MLAALAEKKRAWVRDRSRTMGQTLRRIARAIRQALGQATTEVLEYTKVTGELLKRSVKEARRLAAVARRRQGGRGARAKLTAARRLEELADRRETMARQIRQACARNSRGSRCMCSLGRGDRLLPASYRHHRARCDRPDAPAT
jgi:hypothetical protein